MDKLLSIIISNRNDVAMLCVTVRSCIEEFQSLNTDKCEVVICDNSDDDIYKLVLSAIPSAYVRDKVVKIVRQPFPCLFTARNRAIRESSGKYVLCLDSHMLCGHNSVKDLFDFMERREDDLTIGFAHAPICWAHQHESRARHDRDMKRSELGPWGTAYDHERTITWKGMPWICRRDWFLDRENGLGDYGALSDHRVSWGGGDMHIGIKPWLLGFKNWAVPTRPFIHIGPFPGIDNDGKDSQHTQIAKDVKAQNRYRLYAKSGEFPHTFGFLVSCYVLGGEPMMKRNKKFLDEKFGRYLNTDKMWAKAISIGKDERARLVKRQVMTFDELLKREPWND